MEKLPSEVIFNIFTLLDLKHKVICSKVSRFWNNLISEPFIWKSLNFTTVRTKDINKTIKQLISVHGTKIQSLVLSIYQSEQLTDETLNQILKNCPNLTCLDIGGYWSHCNRIINELTLAKIPDFLPNLTELNISRILNMDGEVLSKIIEKCTKLHHLNICDTNMVLGNWETGALISIGEYLPNLKYYNGFNAISTSHRKQVSLSVATYCKHLEQFYADNIYPEVIQALTENCPNITRLFIPGSKIKDLDIITIANSYPNLELFGISSNGVVTDNSIITLALICPKLEFIRISWCLNITSNSILELVKNCKNLNILTLENQHTITDTNVEEIINYGKKLIILEISTCKHCSQVIKDTVLLRFLDYRFAYTEQLLSEYMNGKKIHWDNIRDEVRRAIKEKEYRAISPVIENNDDNNE